MTYCFPGHVPSRLYYFSAAPSCALAYIQLLPSRIQLFVSFTRVGSVELFFYKNKFVLVYRVGDA